ncbi:uncharacterized protein LOC125003442 [Mugil cephalus]|uniref:uncharacterized protein LOC125003442 n=1 Tax=Mugil cephalus TaxID=48193 RepID=UPI001FB76E1E|nr:uncharacterized protein LOC125003442 [Mugil cephalus]
MLLTGAGCMLVALILYISGVNGEGKSICVLRGSSVDLPCPAQTYSSTRKWYTIQRDGDRSVQKELFADETHVRFNTSNKGLPTLTINYVSEKDAKVYCCSSNKNEPDACNQRTVQLIVSDLQVKVIPATEGQTVMLMCSTSCPLTENPAAYIWYKNREFLSEDWSPWYQELVSSEEAVTYSCAVKGYEDLRAPEVSVDSVTPTCFSVTYAEGRMCSHNQTSVAESCSITYPRAYEVNVRRISNESSVAVSCTTSCPMSDLQTDYRWYQNRQLSNTRKSQEFSVSPTKGLSCAVKDQDHLLSPEVCPDEENCWTVNYISRRICALKGSSVNISSKYSHPHKKKPKSKSWYKVETSGEQLIEDAGRVVFHDNMKNQHVLTIKNLKKEDSAEYKFRLQGDDEERKRDDVPGVTLVVTVFIRQKTNSEL